MDVHCIKCGEPFDADEFHNWEAPDGSPRTYKQNADAFFAQGCAGIGMTCNDLDAFAGYGAATALARDLMGDDIDGITCMLEDAAALGMI